MNRIDQIFRDLRARGRGALLPYLTAGDPDVETTAELLPALEQAGASICEIGFPFSDPIADGPLIQASMTYALDRGVRVREIFEAVARQRPRLSIGLVAMLSYSIVHRLKPGAFISDAKAAGLDGFIFPDLPLEEADAVRDRAAEAGLTCTFLIAPSTPLPRAEQIARACTGFAYVLARAGITGERASLPPDLEPRITRLRGVTELPIAVGFGIADAAQVRQVAAVADGVIVGSAIMRRVVEHRGEGRGALVARVRDFVAELARGLETAPQQASTPLKQ
jgi:tryptophan synthase alpha chain